jgi:hypothetical protein
MGRRHRSLFSLGTMSPRLRVVPRFLALTLGAVAILLLGCLGAMPLWSVTPLRDLPPGAGMYHSSVDARFHYFGVTNGASFSFCFRGRTAPQWRWNCPSNFAYRSLILDWNGESGAGEATLDLPSFKYQSSNSTGLLTRDTLVFWLLGTTDGASASPEVARVHFIFNYLEAAAQGTLPPPGHHGRFFQEPVLGSIHHFLLGLGAPWLVYFWVAVWLLLVVIFTPRFMRIRARVQRGGAPKRLGGSEVIDGPPSVS